MKRFVSLAFCLLCSGLLFAGGLTESNTIDNTKINVVATIFPPFDFARQIAGDKANVAMLLPPGAESHSYEPTPQDIIKIQRANVFIYNGGDSDAWVDRILSSMDKSKMKIVKMMDACPTVAEETVEGMEPDKDEKGTTPGVPAIDYDEHVWTSPANAVLIVGVICKALGEADKSNASYYNTQAASYIVKLNALDKEFKDVVEGGKRREIIVGDRFPFRYFVDRYGLKYYAAFPGCSTQTEASAGTVAFLIKKVRTDKIPVVFHIELSNEKIADAIAEASGAKVMELDSLHNVSKQERNAGATYLSLMEKNVAALKAALN
jgi:zinc transport system substrate-binding protein